MENANTKEWGLVTHYYQHRFLVNMPKSTSLGLLTRITPKFSGFSLKTFLVTLDTYTKKPHFLQFWRRGCRVRPAGSKPTCLTLLHTLVYIPL